ncbi:MAG TPA: hypothetical protein V6D05_02290 [Stenomitos sp.]
MFEHAGAVMDQVVHNAPAFMAQNGASILWTGIALFALRSFMRWGTYH